MLFDLIQYNRGRMVAGTPDVVKAQLTAIAENAGVDEIIATTITEKFEDRVRSYELLAEVFGL